MNRNTPGRALLRAAAAAAAVAALVTGCSHSPARAKAPATTSASGAAPSAQPVGRASVHADGIDLTITQAVAHLDASGNGTLTMSVRNAGGVPEHLAMVATPDAGRGTLVGAAAGKDGMMTSAGILLRPGSTVAFGGSGPSVRLTAVHGVTASRTLPVALEFGVARLVRLSAVVSARP